jgi:hypothetical protein
MWALEKSRERCKQTIGGGIVPPLNTNAPDPSSLKLSPNTTMDERPEVKLLEWVPKAK